MPCHTAIAITIAIKCHNQADQIADRSLSIYIFKPYNYKHLRATQIFQVPSRQTVRMNGPYRQ